MRRYIPTEIVSAEKQGFSAPDASWFKGESIEFVRHCLLDKDSNIYQIFDFDTTQRLVARHLSGTENKRLLIWSLLNFQSWVDQFNPEFS